MKKNNKKFHGGGALLLALILALNMLLPMEALAAPEPGYVEIVIDEKDYRVYQPGGWEWVYDYTPKESTVGWARVPDISFDSEDRIIYQGKYITLDGSAPVVKTDAIIEGGSYTTIAIPLDFTAPESLSMKVTQGHSDLAIDPCVITNTGAEDLKLSQVEITAASGWSVVNASTDFTTADSKNKIAFTAGGHDFADGAYTPGEIIAAGSSTTLQLAGKISEKADLLTATQVASMVLTVEKDVTLISFYIRDTSYQAERGMTWAEWVNSSYNTSGYVIYYNNVVTKSISTVVCSKNDSSYGVLGTDIINADSHYYLCANSG